MVKVINESEFKDLVLEGSGIALVDFFATWCGPCKSLAPVLEEVSKEMEDNTKVYKIDIDENQSLAQEYRVMSVPTMKIFKNGEPVETIVGLQTKANLIEKLKYFSS